MIIKNKEVIYQGLLSIDEYGALRCDKQRLIDNIQEDFSTYANIFLRYYITDKPVTLEEVMTAFVIKCICGSITELYFTLDAYSEWSIGEMKEDFVVGGHDLVDELRGYDGKFLTLIIEEKD